MRCAFKNTKLQFCDILGEPERFFAWLPRKCFDGTWVWLSPAWRRLCVLKPYINGPSDPWWQYARIMTPTPKQGTGE